MNTTDLTKDLELLTAYRAGQSEAGEELARRYHKRVQHLCLNYLKLWDDAQDVTQEVFYKLFAEKKILDFRGEASFWSWLYRVTINACNAWLKKKRRHPEVEIVYGDESEVHPPVLVYLPEAEKQMLEREKKHSMHRAMQELPEIYRKVLIATCIQERTYSETAQELKVPVQTVGVRLMRGKQLLSQCFSLQQINPSFSLLDRYTGLTQKFCPASL